MHRIDGPGATEQNLFVEGNPFAGTPATTVTADWLNAVQEELVELLEALGGSPDKQENDQIAKALMAALGQLATPASQEEAEAGTETGLRRWSPLRVAQAVAALAPSAVLSAIRTYDASGSPHTWTKPSNLVYAVVEVQGAGGGGGGNSADGAAGGGGAGGYAKKLLPAPSLGATETVTVGQGGAGGLTSGSTSGSGGSGSSFGTHCSATAGAGGGGVSGATSGFGGDGGTGPGGDIVFSGARGGAGARGSAGSAGGYGGASIFGGGGAMILSGLWPSNQPKPNTGSGGGGGYGTNGGDGADGIVIVHEYTRA